MMDLYSHSRKRFPNYYILILYLYMHHQDCSSYQHQTYLFLEMANKIQLFQDMKNQYYLDYEIQYVHE